ncbi:hypothetical protein P3X46_033659 [Hevea brasiliensis]|uniref:Uncharacterized protein n=1 Tax=Hevea brasiliensis TaxID=3981 RepID=A0ABQ9KBZ0_HEVBR|nr:protein OXIDATIVE STRESS 3-like [Hevea brasiliensis]KAJ9132830.1 hypothetical protein P3X46_033659 [Hevea brasiliensis]
MENPAETMAFDMDSLRNNLPKKRGLSRYYSGKSRSFTCMADVQCVEDLKKKEHPDAKKRKKYSERGELHIPPYTCRKVSSTTQCATPYVGV